MDPQNIVESQSDESGFGAVLLGGFSSIIDGVTLFGQLTLQQQLREQFPETFPPADPTKYIDPAVAEQRAADGSAFAGALDAIKGINPLLLAAAGVGVVVALVIALR